MGKLDKLGVTGSSPVPPTSMKALLRWVFENPSNETMVSRSPKRVVAQI
jgi:hypothetical protein